MITEDLQKLAEVVDAIGEAIKSLGQVPSGHLYAHLMGQMSFETYSSIIEILIASKKVRQEPSHLLVWIAEMEEAKC